MPVTLSGIDFRIMPSSSFAWGLIDLNAAGQTVCLGWFKTRSNAATYGRQHGLHVFGIARWARFNPGGRQV